MIVDEIEEIEEREKNIRKAKKLNSLTISDHLIENQTILGQVIDLGFVKSESNLPEIMSWAAIDYLESLVIFGDNVNLKEHFPNISKLSFFNLKEILPYQNKYGMYRTESQKEECQLPIEIPLINKQTISGNPRYMVSNTFL